MRGAERALRCAGRAAVAALLLAGTGPAGGQAPVALTSGEERHALTEGAAILEDAGGALTVDDVAVGDPSRLFTPGIRPPRRSLLPTTYWFRLVLRNPESVDASWDLGYGYPLVTRIDLYEPFGTGFTHRVGGIAVAPSLRTISLRGPVYSARVSLAPAEARTVFLRVETRSSLIVAPQAWAPDALYRYRWGVGLFFGVGLGILLVLAALRLYARLLLGFEVAASGGGFLLLFAALMATLTGVGPSYLWMSASGLWMSATSGLAGLTAALGVRFAQEYLDTRARDPVIHRLLTWVAALSAAAGAWSFIDRGTGAVAVAAIMTPGLGVVALAMGRAAWRGERGGWMLLLVASVIVVAGVSFGLSVLGIAPPSELAPLSVMVGFVVGGTLLTVSMTDRALLDSRKARERLQEEVTARTRQLDCAVQRLEAEAVERRTALEALRESEERLRVTFATSPDAMILTSLEDGTFVEVNRAFTEITGWAREEVVGRTPVAVGLYSSEEERRRFHEHLRSKGTVRNVEGGLKLRDGRTSTGLLSATLLRFRGRAYAFSVLRDIGDRKRAEEERQRLKDDLRQAQKLEAVGRLAGGVAHDFNNLLTVIGANCSLALDDLPTESPVRESLLEARDATRRAAGLTRQLLAFGRRQAIAPEPICLSRHVEGMAGMLKRLLGEDLELSFDLASGLAPVLVDPTQFEQVLLNLATNARAAVPRGGRVSVSTRDATLAWPRGEHKPGRYGVLQVEDDGAGMSAEVQARIFEPFFSTRADGSGLGLATVYGIAEQHGGFVEVDSEVGRGSRFRVWFPAATRAVATEERRVDPAPTERPRPGATVLLAEDEDSVRAVARQTLERAGWRVLAARDGAEALALIEAHGDEIEALVTDVVMPSMNGRDLAREATLRRPALPVLYVSGYPQDIVVQNGLLEPGIALLRKPFSPDELAEALASVVARAGVAPA